MTDPGTNNAILTPDELKDLLESHTPRAGDGEDERLARRLRRTSRADGSDADEDQHKLRRAVEDSAIQWGQRMASSYQRRIECSLIRWDECQTADIIPTLLDTDEVVCFSLHPETGFVLLARRLFTALLGLEFGAGGNTKVSDVSRRPYSGIEKRLLARLVRDLLTGLESNWSSWFPLQPEIIGLTNKQGVIESVSGKIMLATLDVTALGVVGRARIAIPVNAFRDGASAPDPVANQDADRLRRGISEVPVTLRAEVGRTEMTLRELTNLRVDDEIPLRPSASEGLLIYLEGRPKFRAVPGRVGSRLAAQAIQRSTERGEHERSI
jgi:flagellar motor switch protein FliM